MLRILIADDHEIMRKGVKQILLEEFPFAYIEEARDGEILVNRAMSAEWDIIISDIAMPVMNGIEALRRIKQNNPELPVLILSMHPEEHYTNRILKLGASGYLSKEAATKELVNAVNRILKGKIYISPGIEQKTTCHQLEESDKPLHAELSDREFEVLRLVAAGLPLTQIAKDLSLQVTTISTYRSRVLEKMNMKSNAELTRYTLENELSSPAVRISLSTLATS